MIKTQSRHHKLCSLKIVTDCVEMRNFMIEILEGIKETVNFKPDAQVMLYYNDENESYPAHWHIPLEIIMPIHNWYDIICNNTLYHLEEQDIIIINPGVIHQLNAPQEGERLIFQANSAVLRQIKELDSILSSFGPILHITPENSGPAHDTIAKLLLSICEEYFSGNSMAEAAIYAKLIEIFVCVGRDLSSIDRLKEKTSFPKDYFEKFLNICSYISEHCTEKLTLDDIAQKAGFSKYHFSHLFKEYTNTSFYKYVNQQRILYASTLLTDPSLSITEIAIRSGFESFSSFNRMFKQLKGCTPSEFRNIYKP